MTVKIIDGCDLYSTTTGLGKKWEVISNVAQTFDTSGGRFGGGSLGFGVGSYVAVNAGAAEGQYTRVGFHFYMANLTDGYLYRIYNEPVVSPAGVPSAGNRHYGPQARTDGSVLIVGDTGVIGQTATGLLASATWYHLEFIANRASGGWVDVYIDGTFIQRISGDTEDGTVIGNSCVLGDPSTDPYKFDDFRLEYFNSEPAPLGVTRIDTLLPTADTAQADYTGTFADIDDAVPGDSDGDTTTITSSTVNDDSRFTYGNIPAGRGPVAAISVSTEQKKSDAGVRDSTPYILSGATEDVGPASGLTESYTMAQNIHEVDPNTGVAWTQAGVNALEAGIKTSV